MPAPPTQIETAPDLVDPACRALLDAIISGALAPGERVTQQRLAGRLAGQHLTRRLTLPPGDHA